MHSFILLLRSYEFLVMAFHLAHWSLAGAKRIFWAASSGHSFLPLRYLFRFRLGDVFSFAFSFSWFRPSFTIYLSIFQHLVHLLA